MRSTCGWWKNVWMPLSARACRVKSFTPSIRTTRSGAKIGLLSEGEGHAPATPVSPRGDSSQRLGRLDGAGREDDPVVADDPQADQHVGPGQPEGPCLRVTPGCHGQRRLADLCATTPPQTAVPQRPLTGRRAKPRALICTSAYLPRIRVSARRRQGISSPPWSGPCPYRAVG